MPPPSLALAHHCLKSPSRLSFENKIHLKAHWELAVKHFCPWQGSNY